MPINWADPAVKDRLLASIIASFDSPINCTKVAQIFGEGATYNAIENFLRGPKREAKKLKEENGDGAVPPSTPRTPKKEKAPGSGIKTGRIAKPKTPSKKGSPTKKGSPIKNEMIFDENDFNMGGSVGGSFNSSALNSGAEADGEGMVDEGEYA